MKKQILWKTIDKELVDITKISDEHLRGIWALCRRWIAHPEITKTRLRYFTIWLKRVEKEMMVRAERAAKIFYFVRAAKKELERRNRPPITVKDFDDIMDDLDEIRGKHGNSWYD